MATDIDKDCNDRPKALGERLECQARKARLYEPHITSLTDFVEQVRRKTNKKKYIPYFDPSDGGIHARCLFLFEAPGSKAVNSGFISRNNPDQTANNFFNLNRCAGLDRRLTVSWNIVPWYIGSGNKIRPAKNKDIEEGSEYLSQLLDLLTDIKIIVLVGRKAQRVEKRLRDRSDSIKILKMPHPSPQCVNRAPENRREEIIGVLRDVKQYINDV